MLEQRASHLQRAALTGWRERLSSTRASVKQLTSMRRRWLLASAVASSREVALNRAHQGEAAASRMARRWGGRRLASMVAAWRGATQEARGIAEEAEQRCRTKLRAQLRSAFAGWQAFLEVPRPLLGPPLR